MSGARSMTGFAEARVEAGDHAVSLIVRSVNNRSLDIRVRAPSRVARLETGIRRKVREHVRRGSVQISLEVHSDGPLAAQIDLAAVKARLEGFRQVADLCGVDDRPDPNALLALPGILQTGRPEIPDETLEALVADCLDRALSAFDGARADEARAMVADIFGQVDAIESEVDAVAGSVGDVNDQWRLAFEKRLGDLLAGTGMDPDRVVQEAAHQAARSDVSEELLRLRAHVDAVRKLLGGPAEVGKRIDFLAQEMNREANTLLSKTQSLGEAGLGVTEAGLRIRRAIEKIREQALNLE